MGVSQSLAGYDVFRPPTRDSVVAAREQYELDTAEKGEHVVSDIERCPLEWAMEADRSQQNM